jgi:outer membrane protein assembly factor BamD
MLRLGAIAVFIAVLQGASDGNQNIHRVADQSNADQKTGPADEDSAEKEITVARFYVRKRDYAGAINRCKTVLTHFPTSWEVEEALGLLVESYLALGIPPEAQTATAVLNRKFSNSGWSRIAAELLKSAGLEPAEDENSWISRALR